MWWIFHVFSLVSLMLFMKCLERTAGMRGMGGEDAMSPIMHRMMRLFFIIMLFGPAVYTIPWLCLPLIIYIPSYLDLSELHGGREKVASTWRIWVWLREYFPIHLEKTVDIDPLKQYIFGVHPHGILPFGSAIALQSSACGFKDIFPNLQYRTLAASICFMIPGYRDLVLAGGVVDASRFSANRLLSSGVSISLVPGGATEALHADPNEDVLVLRKRTGFIKLAMRHGSSLVPVFSFNEASTYHQLCSRNSFISSLKEKFQKIFGMSLPLIKNIIPHRADIHVVVGAPIPVIKNTSPTHDEVEAVLNQYIAGLEQLYAVHSVKYNVPKDKKLIII